MVKLESKPIYNSRTRRKEDLLLRLLRVRSNLEQLMVLLDKSVLRRI
jgi:hypothetical protein